MVSTPPAAVPPGFPPSHSPPGTATSSQKDRKLKFNKNAAVPLSVLKPSTPVSLTGAPQSAAGQLLTLYGTRPQTCDQFNVTTKRGFRQALRGDWNAVRERNDKFMAYFKVLEEARPGSRGTGNAWQKSLSEEPADEYATKKGEGWSQKHRNTLIQWVVEAQHEVEPPKLNSQPDISEPLKIPRRGSLSQSQSEPALASVSRGGGTQQRKRTPAPQNDGRPGFIEWAEMPLASDLPPIQPLRWGREAKRRAEKCSDARTSKYLLSRLTQTVNYKCIICKTDGHDLTLHSCQ